MWHGYVGIEDLGLTANQRNTLVNALRTLGPGQDDQPAHLCHWRTRNDGLAIIFEAEFADADWTIDSIKSRLATIFGVNPSLISATQTSSEYGPVVTFQYPAGTNKLRMIAFAGVNTDWELSRQAAAHYVLDNLAAWSAP